MHKKTIFNFWKCDALLGRMRKLVNNTWALNASHQETDAVIIRIVDEVNGPRSDRFKRGSAKLDHRDQFPLHCSIHRFVVELRETITCTINLMNSPFSTLRQFATERKLAPITQMGSTHAIHSPSYTANTSVLSSSVRLFTCGESRKVAKSSDKSDGSGAAKHVEKRFSNAGACGPFAR